MVRADCLPRRVSAIFCDSIFALSLSQSRIWFWMKPSGSFWIASGDHLSASRSAEDGSDSLRFDEGCGSDWTKTTVSATTAVWETAVEVETSRGFSSVLSSKQPPATSAAQSAEARMDGLSFVLMAWSLLRGSDCKAERPPATGRRLRLPLGALGPWFRRGTAGGMLSRSRATRRRIAERQTRVKRGPD